MKRFKKIKKSKDKKPISPEDLNILLEEKIQTLSVQISNIKDILFPHDKGDPKSIESYDIVDNLWALESDIAEGFVDDLALDHLTQVIKRLELVRAVIDIEP